MMETSTAGPYELSHGIVIVQQSVGSEVRNLFSGITSL